MKKFITLTLASIDEVPHLPMVALNVDEILHVHFGRATARNVVFGEVVMKGERGESYVTVKDIEPLCRAIGMERAPSLEELYPR